MKCVVTTSLLISTGAVSDAIRFDDKLYLVQL